MWLGILLIQSGPLSKENVRAKKANASEKVHLLKKKNDSQLKYQKFYRKQIQCVEMHTKLIYTLSLQFIIEILCSQGWHSKTRRLELMAKIVRCGNTFLRR